MKLSAKQLSLIAIPFLVVGLLWLVALRPSAEQTATQIILDSVAVNAFYYESVVRPLSSAELAARGKKEEALNGKYQGSKVAMNGVELRSVKPYLDYYEADGHYIPEGDKSQGGSSYRAIVSFTFDSKVEPRPTKGVKLDIAGTVRSLWLQSGSTTRPASPTHAHVIFFLTNTTFSVVEPE